MVWLVRSFARAKLQFDLQHNAWIPWANEFTLFCPKLRNVMKMPKTTLFTSSNGIHSIRFSRGTQQKKGIWMWNRKASSSSSAFGKVWNLSLLYSLAECAGHNNYICWFLFYQFFGRLIIILNWRYVHNVPHVSNNPLCLFCFVLFDLQCRRIRMCTLLLDYVWQKWDLNAFRNLSSIRLWSFDSAEKPLAYWTTNRQARHTLQRLKYYQFSGPVSRQRAFRIRGQ